MRSRVLHSGEVMNETKNFDHSALGGAPWALHHVAVSGRPLRVDDSRVVANVARGEGWSEPPREVAPDSARATRWIGDALDEHASVGAFSRLSLQLLGVGAPASLLRRVHRAALDQIRHAELCFGLATRFSGVALSAGPLPLPHQITVSYDLATIAVEALLDGAIYEGLSAADARQRARAAKDEAEREVLNLLSRDEARHAKLGEDLVDWCVEKGGPSVVSALLDALDRVEGVTVPKSLDKAVASRIRTAVCNRVRALLSGRAMARFS